MTHTIAAIKARQNLGDLLNRVSLKHDEFIIERGGRPMAAIIPIGKFEQLQDAARSFLSYALHKNQTSNRGTASAAFDEALLNEAKHQSRKRRTA
jgi:prevent-host-death family protein